MGIIIAPLMLGGLAVGVLTTLLLLGQLKKSGIQQRIVSTTRGRQGLRLAQIGLTLVLWYFCLSLPDVLFAKYAPSHDGAPTSDDFFVAFWVWPLQTFLLGFIPGIASVLGVFLLGLVMRRS